MNNEMITITIICLLFSVPAALTMNDSLHKKIPSLKSFAWGYYVAIMGALSGAAGTLMSFSNASQAYGGSSDNFALGMFSLTIAVVHTLMIRRSKWAWVAGIILQLNPILWIVNGIYLKNRWSEMSGPSIDLTKIKLSQQSLGNRTLIAGSIFWLLVVLTFIFIFEPYGSHISDSEMWQTIKIIIFPPVVTLIGHLIYKNIIRNEINKNTNKQHQEKTEHLEPPQDEEEIKEKNDSNNFQIATQSTSSSAQKEHMVRHNGVLMRVSDIPKTSN